MLTQAEPTTLEQAVAAAPADVFFTMTNSFALRDWLCVEALAGPRPGGHIYAGWNDGYFAAGTFEEVAADEALAFTWRGSDSAEFGRIKVQLQADEGGTNVRVLYVPAESQSVDAVVAVARRWREGLENLASVLQHGVDLRLARRPMIGISGFNDLTPELAAERGIPVSSGVRIGGTVDGMGAAKAGMQRDDVIVSIGGKAVPNGATLAGVMSSFTAGDTVDVEYYRGGEHGACRMELAPRPMPELPADGPGLAAAAREFYDLQNGELAKLFGAATEEQASRKAGPTDWNAKEVVAHLIAVEQDSQVWILSMNDGLDYTSPFHMNLYARMQAIAAAYPTKSEILEELRRSSAITLALLENLPDTIVRRRNGFALLASWWMGAIPHAQEHIAEIASLLKD